MHELLLSETLDRFLVVDDDTGERVIMNEEEGGAITLRWETLESDYYEYTFPEQTIRATGHYFYVNDVDGEEHAFRAYTIVNFDEELPPQSC